MKKTEPSIIASKYAKALFEMCQSQEAQETVQSFLSVLTKTFHNSVKPKHIGNKKLMATVAEQLAHEIKKNNAPKSISNLIELLAKNGRISLLPHIEDRFSKQKDEANQISRGIVYTATQISPESVAQLEQALSKKLSKQVKLNAVTQPDLIGGAMIKIAGWTFDDSLKSYKEKIFAQLKN